jgi:hypothetical protein
VKKPPAPPPRRSRWRWAPAAIALAVALGGIAWLVEAEQGDRQAAAAVAASTATPVNAVRSVALAGAAPAVPVLTHAQLLDNVQLTERTYCSYLESSKYPHGSRPIAEQPDQVYPNAPVNDAHPMRTDGGGSDPKVLIQTSQTRIYLAAGEAVSFSIRAVDTDGKVLPLVVTGASAQGLAFGKQRPIGALSLPFVDDGTGADPVAGDSAFAATLAPAQTALANFDGTIRTRVNYSVNGQNGSVLFDVIYSPALPAIWTGPAREVMDNGSLSYVLKAEVHQAGRYLVSGRVDDARGKPFALVNFNDVLRAGPNEIRLTVFGKLLRDQEPALPLTLRDVDGYLLKENTDPDRALMPRLEGKVATGKARALNDFSNADWDSEEKSRHLAEFGKDALAARAALEKSDPAKPAPAPACKLPK